MSIIRRFVYFCTLVDDKEVSELSTYDRFLVYASFARQMAGATFTFLVFFFAIRTYLSDAPAILIASVLAAIIFLVDQAIIGSEWSLSRSYSGIRGWAMKVFALIPRVAFAIAIALFMAMLAEITLQSRAIDRVLNERTRESNADAIGRLDALAEAQQEERDRQQEALTKLEGELAIASDRSLAARDASLQASLDAATQRLADARTELQQSQANTTQYEAEITASAAELARLEALIQDNTFLRDAEVTDPSRCDSPGSAGCKGDRWDGYNAQIIDLGNQRVGVIAQLESARRQHVAERSSLDALRTEITQLEATVESATDGLGELSTTGRSRDVILTEIDNTKKELSSMRDTHLEEAQNLEEQLKLAGIFTAASYDPLDRRIGLAILHEHPVYGTAAREFSLQLKVVVILFELAPVLVTVFFSPFSFMAVRMRRKRDAALSEDRNSRMTIEAKEEETRANHSIEVGKTRAKADLETASFARDTEIQTARSDEMHFEELARLMETIADKKEVLADLERRADASSFSKNERTDGEYGELKGRIDLEKLKQELIRQKRLTDLLELSRKTTQSTSKGDNDDQDAV
jgi:Domain of unknown function (DUF4407)